MGQSSPLRINSQALLTIVTIVYVTGMFIGLSARFTDLGGRPLADDEYYFIRSVQHILEHGVPRFPSGDYYTRGIVLQYVTAASALLFGNTGFGYRLPAALCSLASVVLLYVYSQKMLGKILALALALTVLVSSWHIEFARFARMYTAFQGVTLLFLIAVQAAFLHHKWPWRYVPHMLAVGAVLTHELGILLFPLVFIPLLLDRRTERFPTSGHLYRFCMVGIATLLVGYLFLQLEPGDFGVTDMFPANFPPPLAGALLQTPAFPFWSVSDNPVMNLGLLCSLFIIAVTAALIARYKWHNIKSTDIFLILLLISTAMHALLISIMLFVILVFRYDMHRYHMHPKRSYLLLCLSLLIAVGWLTYALMTREWIMHVDGGRFGLLWSLRRTFFGWPDLYWLFYLPWSQELPWLGICAVGALAYQIVTKLKDPLPSMLSNPAFIVIYVMICMGVLKASYSTTRYTFFIYPVVLYVIALTLKEFFVRIASKVHVKPLVAIQVIASCVYMGMFALSEDFNPHHLANINAEYVGFRLFAYERFSRTWYARPDYASPSHFLNSVVADPASATRIVVIDSPPISYYLEREHAVYYDRQGGQFYNLSRAQGTVDMMSNNRLLSTAEEVRQYTAGIRTVWLVRPAVPEEKQPFHLHEVWHGQLYEVQRTFLSRDSRIEVLQIQLATDAHGH